MTRNLIYLFTGIAFPLLAAAQTNFERGYGTGDNVECYDAHVTMEGFQLVGRTYSSEWPAFVVRTNFNGDTVWTRRYSGTIAWTAPPTNDGGSILAGDAIVKLNASGVPTWAKTYGGHGAYSIQQTNDGGYIFGGWTNGSTIIKTGFDGTPEWATQMDGLFTLNSVRQTADGGYVVVGRTNTLGAGQDDVMLIRTDASGTVLWSRTYGGAGTDMGWAVQEATNGGFMIVGGTQSFGAGATDVLVIRTDASGDTTWCRTYGGSLGDSAHALHLLSNGQALISGPTQSWGNGFQIYGLFIDVDGDLLWSHAYSEGGSDFAAAIRRTNDGGCIIAATANSQDNFQIVKTDQEGNTPCAFATATITGSAPVTVTSPVIATFAWVPTATDVAINTQRGGQLFNSCFPTSLHEPVTSVPFSIAPNPAQDVITVNAVVGPRSTYTVHDALGRTIASGPLTRPSIDCRSWPEGVLTITLSEDNAPSRTVRFVKE